MTRVPVMRMFLLACMRFTSSRQRLPTDVLRNCIVYVLNPIFYYNLLSYKLLVMVSISTPTRYIDAMMKAITCVANQI